MGKISLEKMRCAEKKYEGKVEVYKLLSPLNKTIMDKIKDEKEEKYALAVVMLQCYLEGKENPLPETFPEWKYITDHLGQFKIQKKNRIGDEQPRVSIQGKATSARVFRKANC